MPAASAPPFLTADDPAPERTRRRSIVLVGLMGVGKTSIGKALAKRLDLPFVDSDAVIEATSGRSIKEIFARRGEAWFRRREHETIRDLLVGEPLVLSTGGGAFMDARTRACARQHGVSVWLRADIRLLAKRLEKRASERPLLRGGDPLEVLKRLAHEREDAYAAADIATESRSIPKEQVVENIIAAVKKLRRRQGKSPHGDNAKRQGGEKKAQRAHIALGARSYDIFIGPGLLADIGAYLSPLLRRRRVWVVADEKVAALHLPALFEGLAHAKIAAEVAQVPPGEESKSFPRLRRLVEGFLDTGIERGDMVLAFGGGVVGDLAGCAAGLALRGVRFTQIPTTLLAQVDSSVGGKTGINVARGKNLVGLFHQPSLVLADTALLATLPPREMRAGYAEVVKYAFIQDASLFARLAHSAPDILSGDRQALAWAVWESCRAKADIVSADEREGGRRALLNFGHSFGHALEQAAGYDGRLLHGEAVSIGMCLAFDFSHRLGICSRKDAQRARAHLEAAGLPTQANQLDFLPSADDMVDLMRRDKKSKDGQLTLILARAIGDCFRAEAVDAAALRDFLHSQGGTP